MPETLNTDITLEDVYLIRRMELAELEQGIAEEMKANQEGMRAQIRDRIAPRWIYPEGSTEGKRNRALAVRLADQAMIAIHDTTEKALPDLTESLITIIQDEHHWQWKLYRSKYLNAEAAKKAFAEVSWSRKLGSYATSSELYDPIPSPEAASLVFGEAIWDQKGIVDRFEYLERQTRFDLANQFTRGMGDGDDIKRLMQRIEPTLGKYAWKSEIIARSETNRVLNRLGDNFVKANKDILAGVRCLATLDDRTCILCGSFDGRTYHQNPTSGQEPIDAAPVYPLHPMCRCTKIPITDLWKKLGIPEPARTRASMFGTTNKGSLGFDQWLRYLDARGGKYAKIPRAVLGNRHTLWKNGGVQLRKFVRYGTRSGTAFGKIRTMKDLRSQYGDHWWKQTGTPPAPPPKPPKPKAKKKAVKKKAAPKKKLKPPPEPVQPDMFPTKASEIERKAKVELERIRTSTKDTREKIYKKPRKGDIDQPHSGHSQKGRKTTKAKVKEFGLEEKYKEALNDMPDWSVDLIDDAKVQFTFRETPGAAGCYWQPFEQTTRTWNAQGGGYTYTTKPMRPQVSVSTRFTQNKHGIPTSTFRHELSHAIDHEIGKRRFPGVSSSNTPALKLRSEGWVRKWYGDEHLFASTIDTEWVAVHKKNLVAMRDQMLKDLKNKTGGFELLGDHGEKWLKKTLDQKFKNWTGNGYLHYADDATWQKHKFTSYGTCNPMENFAEMNGAYVKSPAAFAKNPDLRQVLRKHQRWQIEEMYSRKGWKLPSGKILDRMVELWEQNVGVI